MTKMKTLTGTKPQSNCHKQPCPCGCAECPDDSCVLACIERPTFFYGQVLNDKDLNAVVDYTRKRLALRRLHDGWGVVSGLRAHIDPAHPLRVIVTPGAAIDCCGDDIVICEPFPVDLTCCVPTDPDNCPPKEKRQQDRQKTSPLAVDLYAHYHEMSTDPRTTLTRRSASDVQCEFSRAVESGVITVECVDDPFEKDDSVDCWLKELIAIITRVERWTNDTLNDLGVIDKLDAVLDKLTQEIERIDQIIREEPNPEAQKKYTYERDRLVQELEEFQRQMQPYIDELTRKFMAWLHDYPPYEFNIPTRFERGRVERLVARTLCIMLIDSINEWLHRWCSRAVTCDGVRIARVWLFYDDVTESYQIGVIDNQPPIRRTLRSDCFPVKPGSINISPVVWQPVEEARTWLADRGVRIHENQMSLPGKINDLQLKLAQISDPDYLRSLLFAPLEFDKPFEVYTLRTGLPEPRVTLIGFERAPLPGQGFEAGDRIPLDRMTDVPEVQPAPAEVEVPPAAPPPTEKPMR